MKTAIVIGGSLAGLAATALLRRAGWHVDVFEKAGASLEGRGAGLVTHPELHRGLARAGCVIEDLGVPVPQRVVFDRAGAVIEQWDHPQVFTAWGKLYAVLRAQVPAEVIHAGIAFSGFAAPPVAGSKVLADFSDGQRRSADLLVAADGLRSGVRALLAPAVQPEYAGYVAWRGVVEESMLSASTRAVLMDKFAFCIPPGEQMLGYPVAGPQGEVHAGRRRYNFVWYRPAAIDGALRELMTGIDAKVYLDGIAPHLLDPRHIATMRADAQRLLSGPFAEITAATPQPLIQPIFDLTSPCMAFGPVALMGDASFVARPHCGMGVTKAVSDACELVDSLGAHADIGSALAHYSRQRVAAGDKVVDYARQLGAYMQAQVQSDAERARAEKFRTPHAVIRYTAIAMH